MRGYYPGEREYRERPKPRARRPRPDQPLPMPAPKRPRPVRHPRSLGPAPVGPQPVGLPRPVPRERRRERVVAGSRRLDWVVGIVLGIVLGLAVITAFLVFSSEDTIDAPSVDDGQPAREAPAVPPSGE